MGMFGSILSKIFQSSAKSTSSANAAPAAGATAANVGPTAGNFAPTPSGVPTANANFANVDVGAVLTDMAKTKGEKLNWKESIVDLLKVLDLDSSLAARKELASELQYGGDTSDSAKMNVWLQQQVMQKLAANGGKVPSELRT